MDEPTRLVTDTGGSLSPPEMAVHKPVAPYLHTVLIVALMAGVSFVSAKTMEARVVAHDPRGPLGQYLSTIIWLWLLALLAYLGIRMRKVPLREVVGGRWATFDDVLIDLGIAGGFWVAAVLTLAVVAIIVDPSRLKAASGTMPDAVKNLAPLIPHTKTEILFWIILSISAGLCEEFVFRGYLQRQFSALTHNAALGILLSTLCFAMGHLYQGAKQMVLIGIFGAMFGTLAYFRRSLRAGMIAHAWNDIFDGLVLSLLSHLVK